jgi:HK97 family phage prohead protease
MPIETPVTKERRSYAIKQLKVRRDKDKPPVIEGYASVFNSNSLDLGGFIERVAAGAFTNTLIKNPDVRALIDHESGKILGRTKANTLRLSQDDNGLRVEIDPPDTSYATDLMASMDRGDVDQMSFGFSVVNQRWDDVNGQTICTLLEVDLDGGDVSVVTFPAYPDTSAAIRELRMWQGGKETPATGPTYEQELRQRRAEIGH